MKILIIAQRYPPDLGGGCTRASNITKGLLQLGHKVIIVSAFPRDQEIQNKKLGYKLFRCINKGNEKLFQVWVPRLSYSGFLERLIMFLSFGISSLFPLILIRNVDIIWCANPNLFSMFPSVIYSLFYNIPIVRNVDDLWPETIYDMGFIQNPLVKKILNCISKLSYMIPKAITPLSPSYKNAIINHYKIDENKIFVIEHSVDDTIFYPVTIDDNFYGEGYIVMYSGKLGLAYDFDIIIEAAMKLANIKEIKFVIRGFGECLSNIKNKITKNKLTNVILDTTIVDLHSLRIILNSADVFILPMGNFISSEKGLPTKIFEYQACSKPIICCSQGESAKYIYSVNSGLTVKPGDIQGFCDAILLLYKNKKLRNKLGANGYQYVSQNLTIKKVCERMCEVFMEAGVKKQ